PVPVPKAPSLAPRLAAVPAPASILPAPVPAAVEAVTTLVADVPVDLGLTP
ncbi:MAG: hypothetical protein JWR55_1258, partial [Aeromicrobium sp.]|nr:hypothetical protein [Aeromicrobium sp.]